ncbi:MAG: hypothetical protein CSA55_03230 [Ilumatobacter coccineus]|uniref:4Fe-4S ferredoxin-type domain-containing protein n=1 Tax=Ilumatobacter coccineus TaxID=467094 RepID=A0A2G6KAX4_9ACTN|nr:MAG: hypothetical protein CSA55_03230 [Ilumatobacter coccineus]
MGVDYDDITQALAPTGLIARGGFVVPADETDMRTLADGRRTRCIVVVGNAGDAMWHRWEDPGTDDPLDTWTRRTLHPIADRLGATYIHPNDTPFPPLQRWARRADDVWPSPLGILIHPDYGLWHAYRGALLFAEPVTGLPVTGIRSSPCETCADQPCLATCPVDAFTADGYDHVACRAHVTSGAEPDCLHQGCAARLACPVSPMTYTADQVHFHMRAFLGMTD